MNTSISHANTKQNYKYCYAAFTVDSLLLLPRNGSYHSTERIHIIRFITYISIHLLCGGSARARRHCAQLLFKPPNANASDIQTYAKKKQTKRKTHTFASNQTTPRRQSENINTHRIGTIHSNECKIPYFQTGGQTAGRRHLWRFLYIFFLLLWILANASRAYVRYSLKSDPSPIDVS